MLITDSFYIVCYGHSLGLYNMKQTSKVQVRDFHSRTADIHNSRKRKSTKQAEPCNHPI